MGTLADIAGRGEKKNVGQGRGKGWGAKREGAMRRRRGCFFYGGEGDPSSRPMPRCCLSPPARGGNKEVQRNGDSYLVHI